MAKWSRGMIPALGAGGPGFKSRFGPCYFSHFDRRAEQKACRGHSELNQGPAGLQPDALPLSYIPVADNQGLAMHPYRTEKELGTKRYLSGMGFEPMPSIEDQNSHIHSLLGSKD